MQVNGLDNRVITGVFSCDLRSMFPNVEVAVPRSFRHARFMDEAGKKRAGQHAAKAMLQRGWDASRLAMESGLDPGTVRTFLDGERWPWGSRRNAMEAALGLVEGELELVARGLLIEAEPVDPVEDAIRKSKLNRASQNKLVGLYYEMLDGQEGRRSG